LRQKTARITCGNVCKPLINECHGAAVGSTYSLHKVVSKYSRCTMSEEQVVTRVAIDVNLLGVRSKNGWLSGRSA